MPGEGVRDRRLHIPGEKRGAFCIGDLQALRGDRHADRAAAPRVRAKSTPVACPGCRAVVHAMARVGKPQAGAHERPLRPCSGRCVLLTLPGFTVLASVEKSLGPTGRGFKVKRTARSLCFAVNPLRECRSALVALPTQHVPNITVARRQNALALFQDCAEKALAQGTPRKGGGAGRHPRSCGRSRTVFSFVGRSAGSASGLHFEARLVGSCALAGDRKRPQDHFGADHVGMGSARFQAGLGLGQLCDRVVE